MAVCKTLGGAFGRLFNVGPCSTAILWRRPLTELSLYRPKKEKYPLMYKVQVVNPDGSSYFTRYHEPVGVIRLPVDPSTLTPEELKARLKRNRAEKTVKLPEFKEDVKFDRKKLTRMMKKK